jgi:C4-dicarboxylate-specific signal transduction histidine kinase
MSDSVGGVFAGGCDMALTDAPAGLARAAGLASLGELAGSTIHEVTRPMTGIVASAESSLRDLAREPTELGEGRKFVKRIIGQGRRVGSVVGGLRSSVHNGQLQFAELRIHEAVEEALPLLKSEFERVDITIRRDLDRSTPGIEAAGAQLQELILNLAPNAIDGVADVDGRARVIIVSSNFVDGYASCGDRRHWRRRRSRNQ